MSAGLRIALFVAAICVAAIINVVADRYDLTQVRTVTGLCIGILHVRLFPCIWGLRTHHEGTTGHE